MARSTSKTVAVEVPIYAELNGTMSHLGTLHARCTLQPDGTTTPTEDELRAAFTDAPNADQ